MPPAGAPPPHPPTPAGVTVEEAVHGKARVRVAVTGTRPEAEGGGSTWTETAVSVILRGGAAAAFTEGDNRGVVSTDTVKNVVYVVAARHPTTPPESFGLALAATYLSEYSHVTGVDVRLQSPSAGMQQTLVAMGAALLAESDCAGVGSVRLSLPNLHFLPSGGGVVPLLRGDPAAARLYVPTDEPHGLISAVVRRT
ncbi:hypothetical protein I4F81_007725 [Pyropia yezoensis]|uniref:Uncharacterized protein n=1 Tax=Pyropia yezoensis TaxID=2788 RepID=A0ACC3C628_PYRYE|nr:hypothetical protein I4F81_007725 [Neopyropia yezoensis]